VERTTIAGETEELGENLPQRHFVPPQIPHDQVRFGTPGRSGGKRHFAHYKSHLPDPGSNPGHRGGKPATNRLSCDAAITSQIYWGVLSLSIVRYPKSREHNVSETGSVSVIR
jgi:hypothetical protein